MTNNKLLAAVAVLALVVAAAAVIITPADADGDVTVTDVQYQEEKGRLKVTLSGSYISTPANVTLSGGALEAPIETLGHFLNTAAAFIPLLGNTLEDGTYTIQIDDLPAYDFVVSDEPIIKSIAATATKVSYYVGDSFDAKGLTVTATYTDGTTSALAADAYTYAPAGALTLNDTKVTITLVADEKITTEVAITVKEKQVPVNVTFEISNGFSKVVPAIVGQPVSPIADPKVEGAEFIGWFLADVTEPFNFDTPIAGETTFYAHFGPEAPSTEQTKKFVANIAVEEDACKLVTTAYDGNVIGKGTAAIDVYMMYGGNYVFVDQVKFAIDGKDVYSVDDITEAILTIATEPGQYAVMSTITLDSGASAITNFALFEIEAQA